MSVPELVPELRRQLADPSLERQAETLTIALDVAGQAAQRVWDSVAGRPPRERLRVAVQAAAKELEGIAVELAEP